MAQPFWFNITYVMDMTTTHMLVTLQLLGNVELWRFVGPISEKTSRNWKVMLHCVRLVLQKDPRTPQELKRIEAIKRPNAITKRWTGRLRTRERNRDGKEEVNNLEEAGSEDSNKDDGSQKEDVEYDELQLRGFLLTNFDYKCDHAPFTR